MQPGEVRTYNELVRDGPLADTAADESSDGVFYLNGRRTVQNKVREIVKRDVAGVFLWEAGQDTLDNAEWSLLAAMHSELFPSSKSSDATTKSEL